jgi:hypothetical protein
VLLLLLEVSSGIIIITIVVMSVCLCVYVYVSAESLVDQQEGQIPQAQCRLGEHATLAVAPAALLFCCHLPSAIIIIARILTQRTYC